jgi:transmembrane sensor
MTASSQQVSDAPLSGSLDQSVPADVAQRAVEWLVDLQAEQVHPEVWDDWRRWRAAHPDHERAWQRIAAINGQVFGKLHGLASPVKSALVQAALTPPRSTARRNAISTLTVLIFSGGAVWRVQTEDPWHAWVADHRTAVGERRTVTLSDGTVLSLNTSSAVDVRFGPTERRVRLVAGEISVTTARDAAARPFLVETAHGEARALGTRYTLRLLGEATAVTVFEGAVMISPRHLPGSPQLLPSGQQTRFTADTVELPHVADQDSSAWTDGFIVAKGMRLTDFLAELNRYSHRSLSCDPAVADLRVSGSYPLANIDKILETLSALLSLQIETVTRFWGLQSVRMCLLPRRAAKSASI